MIDHLDQAPDGTPDLGAYLPAVEVWAGVAGPVPAPTGPGQYAPPALTPA